MKPYEPLKSYSKDENFYALIIVRSRKISVENLISVKDFLTKKATILSPEDSIEMVRRTHEDSMIESESFNAACQYTSSYIRTAVRGKLCNHFQCFDLQNFLELNKKEGSLWKCPRC